MVLVGVKPIWVSPEVDPTTGLPTRVPVERVERALAAHPGARAVFLVEPTYVGTLSDIAAHAEVAHAHGIPLVIDQAWGAYFGFHPEIPKHALQAGADAMVTSAHKTLPAYTQSALVFARTERIDRDRLERAFEATATTSPSGTIAASADAARALLEQEGEQLLGNLLQIVDHARDRLRKVSGLVLLDDVVDRSVILDRSKIAINISGTGATGLAIEDHMVAAGMPVELADRDTVVPILSINDDLTSIDRFVDGVTAAIEQERSTPRPVLPSISWTVDPEVVISPRDAFFAPHSTVPVEEAIGMVSAEVVAPYPPGIPVLAPGERITSEAVEGGRWYAGPVRGGSHTRDLPGGVGALTKSHRHPQVCAGAARVGHAGRRPLACRRRLPDAQTRFGRARRSVGENEDRRVRDRSKPAEHSVAAAPVEDEARHQRGCG